MVETSVPLHLSTFVLRHRGAYVFRPGVLEPIAHGAAAMRNIGHECPTVSPDTLTDMKLTPEQERDLARVREASNLLAGARAMLREAVFDALDADVPQARIAAAAGMGRMTLYRWIRAEDEAA